MIGWILLGVTVLLILLVVGLLRSYCTVRAYYLPKEGEENGEMELRADFRLLFFHMNLYPGLSKRLKVSDFSIKNIRKRRKKRRKSPTEQKNKSKNATINLKEAKDIWEGLKLLYEFLREGIYRHLETVLREVRITVASDDAAATAYLYTGILNAVEAILALLDGGGKLTVSKADALEICPDFLETHCSVRADLVFRVRLCYVISALYRVVKRRVLELSAEEERKQTASSQPSARIAP